MTTTSAAVVLALRQAAHHDSDDAARRLYCLLTRPAATVEPRVIADLHALHAEILLKRGRLPAALEAAADSAQAAAS